MTNEQWWSFFGVAFATVLFLADAIWNWGVFQNKPRKGWYQQYGPIERGLRIIIGAWMVAVLVLIALMVSQGAVVGGGNSRAPVPVPPRPQLQAPPDSPSPAAPALAAPVKSNDDLHFWLYDDQSGTTHMVDALEKVPTEFRARARAMR